MDDWRAKHRNVLNLIRYMRKKNSATLQRRYTELRHLHQLCSGNATAMHEVRPSRRPERVTCLLDHSDYCVIHELSVSVHNTAALTMVSFICMQNIDLISVA